MVSTDNIFPTPRGFAPFPSLVAGYPVLPIVGGEQQIALGAYYASYLDGSSRIIVGTQKKLYIPSLSGWVDFSGGQTFSGTIATRWRFAQFGNDTIAVNGVDLPQVASNVAASFLPLAGGPPPGVTVAATGLFVMMGGTSSNGAEWVGSALGRDDSWTPDPATQAARGVLTATPGDITAISRLLDNFLLFKGRSMYMGRYVGSGGIVWSMDLVSDVAGAVSREAVVSMGDYVVFMGQDNLYKYDGAGGPQDLATPLRHFMFDVGDLDQNYGYKVIGRYDRAREIVVWHYPSTRATAAGTIDSWIAWSPVSNQWTQGALDIEAVILPEITVSDGVTYDELGQLFATYGDMNQQTYDDLIIAGNAKMQQGLFRTDHRAYFFTGPVTNGKFRTGNLGTDDDYNFSLITCIRPRFATAPISGGLVVKGYGTDQSGKTKVYRDEAPFNVATGRVNLRQSARFHAFELSMNSYCEIEAFDIEATPAGVR